MNYKKFIDEKMDFKFPDFKKKETIVDYHINKALIQLSSLFKYQNLPKTISERAMKLQFYINGFNVLINYENEDKQKSKFDSGLYALYGGLGGEFNAYYEPQRAIIANPWLNFYKTAYNNEDCIIVPNDALYMGLLPILKYNSKLITEAEITYRIALINTRITEILTAGDDSVRDSAVKFLEQIEEGKLGVIQDSETDLLKGLSNIAGNVSNNRSVTQAIEALQYSKANLYNDIGLQSNYNMKRESLNASEISANIDSLLPFVDNMLETQQTYFDKVNKMFNVNIQLDYTSSWKNTRETMEIELEKLRSEAETNNSLNKTENDDKESLNKTIEENNEDKKGE